MSSSFPGISVNVFEPRQVYATRVGDRKLVYLDHNAWIELRDATTPSARSCLEVCRKSVTEGRAVFPLALPAISEATEIADKETRLRHADLLDSLSNGVTFRSPEVLFRLDAEAAYCWLFRDKEVVLTRQDVLTSVPDHVGEGQVTFPAGCRPEQIAKVVGEMAVDSRIRTVRFIAEQDHAGKKHPSVTGKFVQGMEDNRQKRLEADKLPKQATFARSLLGERVLLIKQYVISVGRDLLIREVGVNGLLAAIHDFRSRKGEGGRQRIKELFRRMPLLDQHARLLALDAMELGRYARSQDFYDVEHGTVAPVFADAFVTLDNRLARLVRDAGRGNATLITSLSELEVWLRSDAGSQAQSN